MGLDEILPDEADVSSSSGSASSGGKTISDEKEYVEEFHSDLGVKKFTEEKWEEIKSVIRSETEYSLNQVRNMNAERRHEILHESALIAFQDKEVSETDLDSDTRCSICGDDCSESYVVIQGEEVHTHHPIAKLQQSLELELRGTVHEED